MNSNILVSSEDKITFKNLFFFHVSFYVIQVCFLLQKNEGN